MTVLVEDTARNNLPSWTVEAVNRGTVQGAVLSPFSTPTIGNGYKKSATDIIDTVRDAGGEAWLDPETHALQMPGAGDFRYYDAWPLWSGVRDTLRNDAEMLDHIERVFEVQDNLGVPHLAPTLLLHSPQSTTSRNALRLAELAKDTDATCTIAIAGDAGFWSRGASLDAHIGALAQIEPGGWWLTVVRSLTVLPVQAIPEDIHGLCRTTRSLSEDSPVHISHGDLAALPAAACGATSIGTGWDPRQRVSSYASYEERRETGDGGQWFQQVTFEGLLSLLTRSETTVLGTQNAILSSSLLPGAAPPDVLAVFLHHVSVLARLIAALQAAAPAVAYSDLLALYDTARQNWSAVAQELHIASRADTWIKPFHEGLFLYGQTEGF